MRDRRNYQKPRLPKQYIDLGDEREFEKEQREALKEYKDLKTDNLYNANSFEDNFKRNAKKFAMVAGPALIGYGMLPEGVRESIGLGELVGKGIGSAVKALPGIGLGTAAMVLPYTYYRNVKAEKRKNSEGYKQFKNMQAKVLQDHDLLVYHAPESKVPGSKYLPQFATGQESRYSKPKDYSIGDQSEHLGTLLRIGGGALVGGVANKLRTNKQIASKGLNPDSEEAKQISKGSGIKGAILGGAAGFIAPDVINLAGKSISGNLGETVKNASKVPEGASNLQKFLGSTKGQVLKVTGTMAPIALYSGVKSFDKAKQTNPLLKTYYERQPKHFSEECSEKYEGLINSLVCSHFNHPETEYKLDLDRTLDTIDPSDKVYFLTCLNEAIEKEEALRKPSVEVTAQSFSERCPFLSKTF